MRDALAERLLAEVMAWTPEDIARERPDLQAMAAYKYDEYQQFGPGMRFIESLASWLGQFKSPNERRIAYEFVKRKLLFCSAAEMNHLVAMAYPDKIRSLLIRGAALDAGENPRAVARIASSVEFRVRRRRCLLLGLSDGARTDVFRRYNSSELSQEQIRQTHEMPEERVESLLTSLKVDLKAILGEEPPESMCSFRTLVLLDDFSASGLSYLRRGEGGNVDGKVGRLHRQLADRDSPVSHLLDSDQRDLIVVLYMATQQAYDHLTELSGEIWKTVRVNSSIVAVNLLPQAISMRTGSGDPMEPIIEAHYDKGIEDDHTRVGGTNLKYGFAGCGLPLVLSHNTPNNSIALLWAKSELMRPLFPRVSRHKVGA
jgi:hypothetical protein